VHAEGAALVFDTCLRQVAEQNGLELVPGKMVWELRPPVRGDKGDGVRRVVAEAGARTVVVIGDDLGDLPAFEAVAALRDEGVAGLLICSASQEEDALRSRADVVVDGPPGVAAWLRQLAERIRRA